MTSEKKLFLKRAALVVGALSIMLGGQIFVLIWQQFHVPGKMATEVTVVIPRGAGLEGSANILAKAGVLHHPLIFKIGAVATMSLSSIKAGEYLVPARSSPREALELLKSGVTVVRKFTSPEGLTSGQIMAELAAAQGFSGEAGAVPREGSLLPETYHYSYGDAREGVIKRMSKAMEEALEAAWKAKPADSPLKSKAELLALASIVEKETGLAAERPRVAAVFLNRLKKGMKLQSDPTIIYGIAGTAGSFERPITKDDLQKPTPYNTYVIEGLPPGPICNPGRASLEAVVKPAASEELYFVADGTGGHAFAKTLEEHNRNVANWRKIERERKQEKP
jgi:UPF0755 protein